MDQVKKRMNKLFPQNESRDIVEYDDEHQGPNDNELLNTIKVPHNLAQLTKRLPKSNYSKH